MAARPKGDPRLADQDIRWFRARLPLTEPEWRVLEYRARRKAFWVAGATQAQIVLHVWHAIDDALREGLVFREFRARVLDSLTSQWGTEIPGRIETIFRTNVQLAYSAGRWWQMNDPELRRLRPWWAYDAVLDSRTTDICRARHGVALPAGDPWWRANYPPLHFNCRSGVRALTEDEVAQGPWSIAPRQAPPVPEGWGLPPTVSEWQPDWSRYPPEIAQALRRKIAEVGLLPRKPRVDPVVDDQVLTETGQALVSEWAQQYGARAHLSTVRAGDARHRGASGYYDPDTGEIVLDDQNITPFLRALSNPQAFRQWLDGLEGQVGARIRERVMKALGDNWEREPWREVRLRLLQSVPRFAHAVAVYTHELVHSVFASSQYWKAYNKNRFEGAMQEALTETWTQYVWRKVAQRLYGVPASKLPWVDIWDYEAVGWVDSWEPVVLESVPPVGYWRTVRTMRELLKYAGVSREEFYEVVEYLKFKVPIQYRFQWLMDRLLQRFPHVAQDPVRRQRLINRLQEWTTADIDFTLDGVNRILYE